MTTEVHELVLTKHMLRARGDALQGNIDRLLESVNGVGLLTSGWEVQENPIGENGAWTRTGDAGDYTVEIYLKVVFKHDTRVPDAKQLASLVNTIAVRAAGNNYGRWTLSLMDGNLYEPPNPDDLYADERGEEVSYTDILLPEDFESYFTHLYGLDSHIGRVKSALESGIASDWNHRFNCVLIGPPGCGKSDICGTIRRMLGDDAVMELDGTATTSAGAIKKLANREVLPRVLVIEEIEKARADTTDFLLSILDIRSEIRKVTARGEVEQEAKLFAIATVNNKELFNNIKSGALSSRFPHKIFFDRPTRTQLGMILEREVNKVEGDVAWIQPTLDYCETAINAEGDVGISDPRQVIALCLSGRDLWIPQPGQKCSRYVRMLNETAERIIRVEDDDYVEVV